MKSHETILGSEFFKALQDLMPGLTEFSQKQVFTEGDEIITEGDETTDLFIVLRGKARAIRQREDGSVIELNIFGPGDYFGEMSFLDGEKRCASVVSMARTEVLKVPRRKSLKNIYSDSVFNKKIIGDLLKKVRSATQQLEDFWAVFSGDADRSTIRRLIIASECKDNTTASHIIRVSRYSAYLAKNICTMNRENADKIGYAASMHDVGKIGIPESILLKPGKLTHDEFEKMKMHTYIGAKILSSPNSDKIHHRKEKSPIEYSDIMEIARRIALYHHEHYDGTGYPEAKKGNSTPIEARIVSIADVFDAMITKRPYKNEFPIEYAIKKVNSEKGKQFDGELVDIFLRDIDQLVKIKTDSDKYEYIDLDQFSWDDLLCQH